MNRTFKIAFKIALNRGGIQIKSICGGH